MLSTSTGAPSIMPCWLRPVLQLCALFCLLQPMLTLTVASPIGVPDLQQCQLARDTAVVPPIITIHVNCCLPVQQAVKFSFASYTRQKHVRRRAHKASEDYIAKYTRAYDLMRSLPEDDPRSFATQAKIHCAFCNFAYMQAGASNVPLQVHFSWIFLPWHRWYLYFHERILASLIGDPEFSLLFWNWDDQRDGGNVLPAMFARNGTSLYDPKRNPAHQPPALVQLSTTTNDSSSNSVIINANLNAMYQGLVTANTAELFMGGAYRTGTDLTNSTVLNAPLGGSIENGVHNAVHFWTGNPNLPLIQDMGTFTTAARDPVFFAHHSNVDRLWEVWHSLPGGNRHDHTDSDFLNAEFYFYDEHAQLVTVTVRDALDNTKLGVSYEKVSADQLWINYSPPAATNGSAVVDAISMGTPIIGASPENPTIHVGARLVALVARPSGKKPSNAEEVLMIQGVEVSARRSFVSLVVFVNLPQATNKTATDTAEYVGTLNILPSHHKITMNVKLEIGDNLKRIGIDNEERVVITFVVNGPFKITIQGLKISYESST